MMQKAIVAGILALTLLVLAGGGCERAERLPAAPAGSPAEVTPTDLGAVDPDLRDEPLVLPEPVLEVPPPSPQATDDPAEEAPADVNDVDVVLLDFAIEMPGTLPAGPTAFKVTNRGEAPHNFRIEGQGLDQAFETNIEPGETMTMTVNLTPGDYHIHCPVSDHHERGMMVMLSVEGPVE